MAKIGHPTKLTEALGDAICSAVAEGVPLGSAAVLAGVSPSTVKEWMARGQGRHERPPTPLYAAFATQVEKARAQDESTRLQRLADAARGGQIVYEKITTFPDGREVREVRYQPGQWTADAWVLERARPDQWGRRQAIDLQVSVQEAAARVAAETGLTVEDVLGEATDLLKALDHAAR